MIYIQDKWEERKILLVLSKILILLKSIEKKWVKSDDILKVIRTIAIYSVHYSMCTMSIGIVRSSQLLSMLIEWIYRMGIIFRSRGYIFLLLLMECLNNVPPTRNKFHMLGVNDKHYSYCHTLLAGTYYY